MVAFPGRCAPRAFFRIFSNSVTRERSRFVIERTFNRPNKKPGPQVMELTCGPHISRTAGIPLKTGAAFFFRMEDRRNTPGGRSP